MVLLASRWLRYLICGGLLACGLLLIVPPQSSDRRGLQPEDWLRLFGAHCLIAIPVILSISGRTIRK